MPFSIDVSYLSSGEFESFSAKTVDDVFAILSNYAVTMHDHVIVITPFIDSERLEEIE